MVSPPSQYDGSLEAFIGDISVRREECDKLVSTLFYNPVRTQIYNNDRARIEKRAEKTLKWYYSDIAHKRAVADLSVAEIRAEIETIAARLGTDTCGGGGGGGGDEGLEQIPAGQHSGQDLERCRLRLRALQEGCKNRERDAKWMLCPNYFECFLQFFADSQEEYESTPELARSEEFIDFFFDIAWTQWRLVCQSPYGMENQSQLNFTRNTLALLYLMRMGGVYMEDVQVVPACHYVTKYVPPKKDLVHYDLQCSYITRSTKQITSAYGSLWNAGTGGLNNGDLAFDRLSTTSRGGGGGNAPPAAADVSGDDASNVWKTL
jgi:hypothetical protein